MKAIILSAGRGTRLRPLTDDRPKGMVEVAGKPIIQWQVEMFRDHGIDDIAIVTGYRADSVVAHGARLFHNPDYEKTNMVHSMFCAQELLEGEVLLSYADILYSSEVLTAVLEADAAIAVAVDLEWESYFSQRLEDPYEDAESLLMDETGAITSIGKPAPDPEEVEAQYMGLIGLRHDGAHTLSAIHADAVATDAAIGWGRPVRNAYMTDLLYEAVLRGHRVTATQVLRGWVEVDTLADHEIANAVVPELMGDDEQAGGWTTAAPGDDS